eukprot:6186492-Pleurochrysis_carterae.AAC.2
MGFRKAELVAYLPKRKTWLTRASLLWLIGRVSTKHPTPLQLEALSAGDRCGVSPRQSKCDATGEVWGDRLIALAYIVVPGNAAKALAYLELAFPVEASARETTPLLLPTTLCHSRPPMPMPTNCSPPCLLIVCVRRKPRATAGIRSASDLPQGCSA